MSEAVSAAPAASASPAPSTPAPAAAQGPSATPDQSAQAGAPAADATAAQQDRILGDADLDAFIEQKINGKVERIKVRDALKGYGMEKTANQRMQEAARIQKQQQQLNHLFETDFDKWCEVTGKDPNAFLKSQLAKRQAVAEEVLAAAYEREQMDPHQREALEYKEKVQQYEQRELAQKQPLIEQIKKLVPESMLPKGLEKATAEQLERFVQVKQQEFNQGIDNLSNELLQAWQEQGLPKQKEFGQWMAQTMSDYQKRTGEALQPAKAAAMVKSRFLNSTKTLLSQMDAKAIHETLGEDVIKKLREYDIEQVRSSGPQFGKTDSSPAPAASEERKYLNETEWRKKMGIS